MKKRRLFNDIWFTWPCEATTLVNVSANVQCCRSRGPFDGAQFQRWRGARWKWNDRRLRDRIGASVVLSSEMLSQVPAMTVAPLASEIDSLLLGEEHDNVAEECGDCAEGSALSECRLRHQPYCIGPELPEFREPTGASSAAKLAKTHPWVLPTVLFLHWSAYLWHRQTCWPVYIILLAFHLLCDLLYAATPFLSIQFVEFYTLVISCACHDD